MARKARIEFPGAFYHVLARGNNKQEIFRDDQDFKVYIMRLKDYQKRFNFILYAYTLMPNHIHLLVETNVVPLSKIMQGIQQSYTSYFHHKHKTVGHLFQGRYRAILCQKESYLMELVRYIHLNPVRASLAQSPDDYHWSSHRVYLGHLIQSFVRRDFILRMFSEDRNKAEKLYSQFIGDGMNQGHREEFYGSTDKRLLGNLEFVKETEKAIEHRIHDSDKDREKNLEFLRNQLQFKRRSLDSLLNAVTEVTGICSECILSKSKAARISDARALFAFVSSRYAGIGNKSLAFFLKRTDSSISNMIRKVEEGVNKNRLLSEQSDKIIKVMKV